jgi:hypothetical protein
MRRLFHYARNIVIWAAVTIGAFILLPATWLAVAAGALFIAYLVSLVLHPRVKCWDCDGSGRHSGGLFSYADRACTTCGGQSRHRRFGLRVISSGRQVWAERAATRARGRSHRPL